MGGADCNNYKESGLSLDLENLGIEHYGPEKIIRVEDATVVGSGEGSNTVVNSCNLPVERQHVQGGSSVEPIIGTETAAVGEEARTGNRKTKLVKKMVIVKKVIKKRVPKRVLRNGSENQGVVVKAEDSVNLGENSDGVHEVVHKTGVVNEANGILSIVDDLTESSSLVDEKSDHVDRVTEKTSIVDKVMGKENITDKGTQVLKFENAPDVSVPIIGKKGSNLNGITCMDLDRSKLNSVANFTEKVVPADDLSGINTMEKDNVNGNDVVNEVDRNKFSNPCLMEVGKFSDPGTISDSKEISDTMMEHKSEGFVVENEKIDNVDKVDVELLAGDVTGPVAEKTVVLDERENGRTTGEAESCSEMDTDRIGLTEGLLLSEEMEALERKRRRKTEIFVGGLAKDTKEDHIRKVFGEAGVIVEVRLVMSSKAAKKTRGFAFVRFATAAEAKNAVAKYSKVEICGKQCNVAPAEGNDTIFLGSIDRNWKTEDVVAFLEEAGIGKIDGVTLKADPNDIEKNRGFAFVEFQTSKDAKMAFYKLQKKDVFGKKLMLKVEWAQPLTEPSEEELLRVKSVFAEYLPSSWDEEKLKNCFKRFGEIEDVVLAKDLPSSRRKDIAFINYTTRDAALTCIETVNRERLEDDCSKVKIAVSLAKPVPKGKQMKHTSDLTSKQLLEPKEKAFQTSKKLHEFRNKEKAASSSYGRVKADNRPSTTDELVQILRQQASNKDILLHPITGTNIPDHHFTLPGSKRPFSAVTANQRHDPIYVERQVFSRTRVESSYPLSGPSASSHGVGLLSVPYHQRRPGFASESVNERRVYPSHFQTREQAPYHGDSNIYHRCDRYR